MIIRDIIYENGDTDYFGNPLKSYTEFDTDAFGNYPEPDSDIIPDEYDEPTTEIDTPIVVKPTIPKDISPADKYINAIGGALFNNTDSSKYRENMSNHFPTVLSTIDNWDLPAMRWLYHISSPYRVANTNDTEFNERMSTWFNTLDTSEQERLKGIETKAKGEAMNYHFKRKFDKLMDNF
jgi:hypothetical protein